VVDLVRLWIDGPDVVDELKVLARVDGVHGLGKCLSFLLLLLWL
jgi:butyrate kinase